MATNPEITPAAILPANARRLRAVFGLLGAFDVFGLFGLLGAWNGVQQVE